MSVNYNHHMRIESATQDILKRMMKGQQFTRNQVKKKYKIVNPYMIMSILRKEGHPVVSKKIYESNRWINSYHYEPCLTS